MTSGKDGAGHEFIEFEMTKTEQIRVTYIPDQEWAGGPTIRIQKHSYTGKMHQGPEFPAERAMELVAAVSQLVTGR